VRFACAFTMLKERTKVDEIIIDPPGVEIALFFRLKAATGLDNVSLFLLCESGFDPVFFE
jgi:hypothetical protein